MSRGLHGHARPACDLLCVCVWISAGHVGLRGTALYIGNTHNRRQTDDKQKSCEKLHLFSLAFTHTPPTHEQWLPPVWAKNTTSTAINQCNSKKKLHVSERVCCVCVWLHMVSRNVVWLWSRDQYVGHTHQRSEGVSSKDTLLYDCHIRKDQWWTPLCVCVCVYLAHICPCRCLHWACSCLSVPLLTLDVEDNSGRHSATDPLHRPTFQTCNFQFNKCWGAGSVCVRAVFQQSTVQWEIFQFVIFAILHLFPCRLINSGVPTRADTRMYYYQTPDSSFCYQR